MMRGHIGEYYSLLRRTHGFSSAAYAESFANATGPSISHLPYACIHVGCAQVNNSQISV